MGILAAIAKHFRAVRAERGFSFVELIVSLGISSMVFAAAIGSFNHLSHLAYDNKLRIVAQLEAQSVIELMTSELRMIGNGVPFHQPNFLIAQADLGDNTVTQPILVDGTTAEQIRFRLNETGETYILTSDFDPGAGTVISLTDVSKILIGDEIYLTNSTVGQDDGLWGTVTNVNSGANTVTIAGGAQYSVGAVFEKGSLFEVVPVITYTSNPYFGGITRDNGSGELNIVPAGQFSLTYLNGEGDDVELPLVASDADPFPDSAIQNVHAIRVTVQVRSPSKLRNGEYYVATAEQTVGIRNLNFKY